MLSVKKLFLIDGIGAVVSAIMLGFVLPQFHEHIGMPLIELFILATIPVLFIIYDLFCYRSNSENGKLLLGIAIANLSYSALSANLVSVHFSELTILGLMYFAGEILIILVLVIYEIRVAMANIKASKE